MSLTDDDGIDGPFERRMTRITAQRGQCSYCRKVIALRKNGGVRFHRFKRIECPGVGLTYWSAKPMNNKTGG